MVVGKQAALAAGVSRWELRQHLEAKRWRQLLPGVYFEGQRRQLTHQDRLIAALTWAGPRAAFSHLTAAVLHELHGDWRRNRVELTIRRDENHRHRGIHVHRRDLHPSELTTVGGHACTTLARTVVDLCGVLRGNALFVAFESAWRLEPQSLPLQLWTDYLKEGLPFPGRPALERLVDGAWRRKRPAASPLEDDSLAFHLALGLPEPEVGVTVFDDDGPMVLDFAFPERNLAIETDGAESHAARMVKDAHRRNRLLALGLTHSSITHDELTGKLKGGRVKLSRRLRAIFKHHPPRRRRWAFEDWVVMPG